MKLRLVIEDLQPFSRPMGGAWQATRLKSDSLFIRDISRSREAGRACSACICLDKFEAGNETVDRRTLRFSLPLSSLLYLTVVSFSQGGLGGQTLPLPPPSSSREMRISIHLTDGITVACRYLRSTVLAPKSTFSRCHLPFDSRLSRSRRPSRRPESIVKVGIIAI